MPIGTLECRAKSYHAYHSRTAVELGRPNDWNMIDMTVRANYPDK